MMYIQSNKSLIKTISKNIRKYAPIRKSNKGTTPGMASEGLKIEQGSEDKQWHFIRKNPSEEEIKEMIGTVTEIAIMILWQTYCYDFGGKTYMQREGGPIGQRPTMAASRLVMQDFFEKYHNILVSSGLRTFLMKVHVDDGRQVTSKLPKGMRYNEEEEKFTWNEESQEEDEERERERRRKRR